MVPTSSRPERRAGVLLHPTSLPGPYGIGDIGPGSRRFVGWLASAGQTIWQMLPVQPTDDNGSPYASPSAFARSPLLLSVDDLVDDGWLTHAEKPWGAGSPHRVDYPSVARSKLPALHKAADRIAAAVDLDAWAKERPWVADWALFTALCTEHKGAWTRWPAELRDRDEAALQSARDRLRPLILRHTALQWTFEVQWRRLRAVCAEHEVSLWGDVPFFVGGEACDVWAHRDLYRLDEEGRPTALSGVPPDVFSAEGQLWGTPLYDNEAHAATGYRWWVDRLVSTLELFDEVRLDHFRGLAGVWEIPRDGRAIDGKWIDSLGAPMLRALQARLGRLPLIAEDLGIITPDVEALRDDFGLPGMVILQFAFASAEALGDHPYLPHNHRAAQVVYPGTHDNDTCVGWYSSVDEQTRDHFRRYLSCDGRDPSGELLRCAYRSVARDAVVPMQDVLGLDGRFRMNVPGLAEGNWAWRAGPEAFGVDTARYLAYEARLCGRARR
jgi:4-alpha-glucanotransferase